MLKVCQIAFYLYAKQKDQAGGDDWNIIKSKLLGDMQLLNNLRNFDINQVKGDMSKKAKNGIKNLLKEMQ